jgi:chromosome segregation ATPase
MTNSNQSQQQKVSTNPNPTMVELSDAQELNTDLEEARKQIKQLKQVVDTQATVIDQRDLAIDSQSRTISDLSQRIGSLDKEVAQLKDDKGKAEMQRDSILETFNNLYGNYQQLYDQVINASTALSITSGKLAEALIKNKFTIPQAGQPNT